jgi:hypothetical protein
MSPAQIAFTVKAVRLLGVLISNRDTSHTLSKPEIRKLCLPDPSIRPEIPRNILLSSNIHTSIIFKL